MGRSWALGLAGSPGSLPLRALYFAPFHSCGGIEDAARMRPSSLRRARRPESWFRRESSESERFSDFHGAFLASFKVAFCR